MDEEALRSTCLDTFVLPLEKMDVSVPVALFFVLYIPRRLFTNYLIRLDFVICAMHFADLAQWRKLAQSVY